MLNTHILEAKKVNDRFFLTKYADKFERFLSSMDDDTKHIVRKNKQLNDLYDLFLDYIIDCNQYLEKENTKKNKKDLD